MIYHSVRTDEDEKTMLSGSFLDLRACVLKHIRMCEKLDRVSQFDIIAVQGVSGMAVGFPLALALGKEIVVLRKENEESHGCKGELIGGRGVRMKGKRCLFVDDFVSMGHTRTRVREAVERAGGKLVAQCTNDGYTTL